MIPLMSTWCELRFAEENSKKTIFFEAIFKIWTLHQLHVVRTAHLLKCKDAEAEKQSMHDSDLYICE